MGEGNSKTTGGKGHREHAKTLVEQNTYTDKQNPNRTDLGIMTLSLIKKTQKLL